jgi:hypothetical protein
MGPPPPDEEFIASGEEKDVPPGQEGVVPVDLTLIRDQFLRAHVVAADDLGELNQIAVIPFVHNLSADMLDLKVTPYRSVLSESSFWTVHVVSCYEAGTSEDRDNTGDECILGRSYGAACVFMETIRDLTEDAPPANAKSFSIVSKRIALHEILHRMLGTDHDVGIMDPDNLVTGEDAINVLYPGYHILKMRRLNRPL